MSIAEKLTTIAENVPKVFEAGKEAENNKFWSLYTQNGMRDNCSGLFSGEGWNEYTFTPPNGFVIKPLITSQMFSRGCFKGVDLVELLKDLNVVLDFSRAINFTEIFYQTGIKRIGVLDTTASTNLNNMFAHMNTYLETVDLLILKNDGSQTFNASSFVGTNVLKNITIQGVIGKPNVNLKDFNLLTKASITSFINALSTTTSGVAITFSKMAVNKVFETSEGVNNGSTSTEWANLIATKSNWTISLA